MVILGGASLEECNTINRLIRVCTTCAKRFKVERKIQIENENKMREEENAARQVY